MFVYVYGYVLYLLNININIYIYIFINEKNIKNTHTTFIKSCVYVQWTVPTYLYKTAIKKLQYLILIIN